MQTIVVRTYYFKLANCSVCFFLTVYRLELDTLSLVPVLYTIHDQVQGGIVKIYIDVIEEVRYMTSFEES